MQPNAVHRCNRDSLDTRGGSPQASHSRAFFRAALSLTALGLVVSACGTADTVVGPCDLPSCNDGLACTTDGCAKDGSCTHTPSAGACDDGNACTTDDVCVDVACVGVTKECDDKIACTSDSCSKTKGCVYLAGDPTICDDKNICTNDACDVTSGCKHTGNTAACDDGNACTLNDGCAGGACLPGDLTVVCDDKNPCTNDACDPKTGTCSHVGNTATCSDGNACTDGDTCGANGCVGTLNCACAVAAGQKLPSENCDTPIDDNCDGVINEVATCGPTVYKYSAPPEKSDAASYYDEAHNIAVNGPGQAANNTKTDTYATGQLLDGVKGADDWLTDLGNGMAFEWVAWTAKTQSVTVQFAKPRNLALVRVGMNNANAGTVLQPPKILVRTSSDGVKWSTLLTFATDDGTQPLIPDGHRGDVELALPVQTVRYVEIRFETTGSWTFIDELEFD